MGHVCDFYSIISVNQSSALLKWFGIKMTPVLFINVLRLSVIILLFCFTVSSLSDSLLFFSLDSPSPATSGGYLVTSRSPW